MVRSYFSALLAIVLLAGCAAKQPVLSNEMADNPLFNVKIEPVTTPQLYRYGPTIGQAEVKITTTTFTGKTTNMSMLMKYSIIEKGDALLWHVFIPEWTEGGKLYQPRASLLDLTMDMDHRGIVEDTHITFPIIKAYNITDPNILKGFDNIANNLTELAIELPEAPIVSGAPVSYADLNEFKALLSDIDNEPCHKLDGEFSFDGVRYVSTTLNDTFSGTVKSSGERLFISINARNIFRKDTMENVYGYGKVEGKDARGKVIFTSKMIIAKTEAGLSH